MMFCQLAVPVGALIIANTSDRLRETLYWCDWMSQPREIQRAIITMQTVANRPLHLTSGRLYNLSLESYTKVLSAVYSYTNVLQSLRS
ncbi:uncharacterized protein LOC129004467 [Macrosteles quadrilineatus]|uniref:uncharacterized protein LOC129004467 n=1 Tax=Macrosteles quadrilineatus TaxID=74068 RepID=UPI0023E290F7|nr:uncharacterized protein LOC129004467 [Macrosteles quadrilineatus]